MRGADVLLLLKKLTPKGRALSMRELAEETNLSVSSVSESLERCKKAHLVDSSKKRVNILSFQEFIVHALAYVFPAEAGRTVRGVPTYVSASPLKEQLSDASEQYVWHYAKGEARGQRVDPLYPTAPEAALRDDDLYRLLVIADTLRMGRAREKEIAIAELNKYLQSYAENE